MSFLRYILKKEVTKEISAIIFVIIFLYVLKNIINLLLMTFLFTYLIYILKKNISCRIKRYIEIKDIFITITLYLIIFIILVYFICKYIPTIINQSVMIMNELIQKKGQFNIYKSEKYLNILMNTIDIKSYIRYYIHNIIQFIGELGNLGINIVLALILSLFFMIEKTYIIRFLNSFKTSRMSALYNYICTFSKDFFKAFGKFIRVQVITAITNTLISLLIFTVMKFPACIAISFMIFAFSLIPVIGIILSLIPLAIIAFNVGGIIKVAYISLLIIILWIIESYIVIPKFMYDKIQIPVFFIFIILIISQHFMGAWGMIVGVPIAILILHMFGINLDKK